MNKKKGRIIIQGAFLRDVEFNKQILSLLFSQFIPVDIRFNVMHNESEYFGYSELFDEINEGQPIPEYRVNVVDDKEINFTRVKI